MVSMNLGTPGIFDLGNDRDRMSQMQQQYGIDPTMGQFDFAARGDQSRTAGFGGQQAAMEMYRKQMLGLGGPSLAQQQMQMGLGQAQRGAMGMAAMGRGGNMAGMQSQALNAGAGMALQTNAQMGLLRAQEQQAAQAGYAGMANQMYGQGFGYDQLAQQSRAQAADNQLGFYSADRGMDLQQDMQNHQKTMDRINMGKEWGQMISGAVGGGMGAGMGSDNRMKSGLAPSLMGASEAVGNITPVGFEYKPGMGPPGHRLGVSAQDLAANPATASLVRPGPDGMLRVEEGGLAALATAATAEQEQRLRAIEARLGGANPFAEDTYAPDADVSFDDRVSDARARRPPGRMARKGMAASLAPERTATIDPFNDGDADDMRVAAAPSVNMRSGPNTRMVSDERAKTGMASTITQQKTRNAGGY